MALVKMSTLLKRAEKKGIGCGAFNVYSLEALMGAIRAAEELKTPIILQLAEARFPMAPLELAGPMMVGGARAADVEIAVHLDHGSSLTAIKRALEIGFTSVMYDGSALPFEQNAANTRAAGELAGQYHAELEGELGLVGRGESGERDYGVQCTVPEDARAFVEMTGVDALAVAIGNQHGNYKAKPDLRFDILRHIHGAVPDKPLVLHGGSGITDRDFQKCIRCGITKINIATAILNGMAKKAELYVKEHGNGNYCDLNRELVNSAYEVVKHHIRVFNMEILNDEREGEEHGRDEKTGIFCGRQISGVGDGDLHGCL